MAISGQGGRRRPAALALAGAAVMALTGCATAQPEAALLGGPEPASAAGTMASAEPAGSGTLAGSGTPIDPDQAVSSTDSANPDSRAHPASTAGLTHCPRRSSFILSLVSGYHGWASPVEAAQQFSRRANMPGYGTPDTVWTAHAPDASGVTLTAPDLMLQAVRLPNGRWAIISGERCG